jgi:hypothetical protein
MRDIKHVTHFVLFQTKVDAPFRGTVVAPQAVSIEDVSREFSMKSFVLLLFSFVLCETTLVAQSSASAPVAIETIQQSQSPKAAEAAPTANQESPAKAPVTVKLPAGTPIDVESAYTVSSIHVKPGELLSFRVLIPVIIDGVVAIEKGALVTARVTVARRGGHWGKAGRLAWTMQDVIAVDNTRVLLAAETSVRNPEWLLLKPKGKNKETDMGQGSVKGTSHGGEVAAKTIIAAAIFPPLAPLALMNGFRRGENAVLPEGKRFVVVTRNDSSVSPKGQ